MDIATVTASVSASLASIKEMCEVAKTLMGLAHDAEIKTAVAELQSKLLDHQTKYMELLVDQHRTLMEKFALEAELAKAEKRLAEREEFQAKLDRYRRIEVVPGFEVYALKRSVADGEPPRWLCPQCAEKGMIGLIQAMPHNGFAPERLKDAYLKCLNCGTERVILRQVFIDALKNR